MPYARYRIVEANKPELVIKPTCAGCGMIAGVDCQRSCEYIFKESADVTEPLPIELNEDHQFAISVSVAVDGKNFGNKKPKHFWFNSVRCAELFLMEHGCCKRSKEPIGNGVRLAAYLGISQTPTMPRRGVRASTVAKQLVWQSAGLEQQKSLLQAF